MSIDCKPLRDTARDAICQVRLPVCRNDRATSVWAHSDAGVHGKGKGLKADDPFGFHACGACHAALPGLKRAERERVETIAMHRTWRVLWISGVIGMVGSKPRDPLPARMVQRQRFSEATARPAKIVPRRVPG